MKNKPKIMYALFSSKNARVPKGLFHSKWKAKEAQQCLWNTPSTWFIEKVLVESKDITHYDIYKYSVKRI